MEKITRYLFGGFTIGIAIGVAMALLASSVQADTSAIENVSIESGEVYYDGISCECAIILENMGNENVTASIRAEVDQIEIANIEANLTIEYFKGFRIKTHKSIFFEVPCKEGNHEIRTFVSVGNITRATSHPYEAYGFVEEEEEEPESRYNKSKYPPFESEEMKIVMITEEIGGGGSLCLRIIIESNGNEYSFAARKRQYWDDETRENLKELWLEYIREVEEDAGRDWKEWP